MAIKLKIPELKLIKKLKNLKCLRCGLIYKKYWFNKKTLELLFNNIISVHPKGWDTNSKKFSKKFFKKNINLFKNYLKDDTKKFELTKVKRELLSIVDSIQNKNYKIINIKSKIVLSIKNNNIKKLENNFLLLKEDFNNPEEFKRFKGFNSNRLNFFIQNLIGEIKSYSETGCPLWGSFKNFNKDKVKCTFIKSKPYEFWGLNCKKNKVSCYKKLDKNIRLLNNFSYKSKKVDYTAIYLYLDHVLDPLKFLKKVFSFSNSAGLILESSKDGIPVQHFTGWNSNSINYIAKKLNKKVFSGFLPLNKTGKNFYLLK